MLQRHHVDRTRLLLIRRGCLGATGLWLISALGCAADFKQEATRFTTAEWTYHGTTGSEMTSDHYVIYTTCKHKPFVQALPGFLETCYDAYVELLPAETMTTVPLPTYLFQHRGQWERFTREFSPGRAKTYMRIRRGGYTERGVTVSHYSTQRSSLSILAHEGLHQFLSATGRDRIPAWINEGLACYFESFDLASNRPTFDPRNNTLRTPALREALSTESLIPLRHVLATNAGLAVHQKSQHVYSYYAQEWSLILFLLDSPMTNPYYAGFRKLLDELGTEAMKRKTNGVNIVALFITIDQVKWCTTNSLDRRQSKFHGSCRNFERLCTQFQRARICVV